MRRSRTNASAIRRLMFALGFTVPVAAPVHSQAASVSPQAVLLTDVNRVGTLNVLNPYSSPLDIIIDLRYGYVATDAQGRTVVELPGDSVPARNSAVPILRISPAHFVLAPGEVQQVRIAAFPNEKLDDGEYWARIGVQAVLPPSRTEAAGGGISVGVGVQVKTVLPIFYRHHRVATAVQLADFDAARSSDSLVVTPTFVRSGSAAALLAVETIVTDASGGIVARVSRQAAVYNTLSPRYAMMLTPAQWARASQVRISATSQRPDLPAGLPLTVTPVSRIAAIRRP